MLQLIVAVQYLGISFYKECLVRFIEINFLRIRKTSEAKQAVIAIKDKFQTFVQTWIFVLPILKLILKGGKLSSFQYRLIWISDIPNRLT